jgi:hypothetical protein
MLTRPDLLRATPLTLPQPQDHVAVSSRQDRALPESFHGSRLKRHSKEGRNPPKHDVHCRKSSAGVKIARIPRHFLLWRRGTDR